MYPMLTRFYQNTEQVNVYSPNEHIIIRTTLKPQDKEHKILHRKLKIGQHEPYNKTQDKEHNILHIKLKIGQQEPH